MSNPLGKKYLELVALKRTGDQDAAKQLKALSKQIQEPGKHETLQSALTNYIQTIGSFKLTYDQHIAVYDRHQKFPTYPLVENMQRHIQKGNIKMFSNMGPTLFSHTFISQEWLDQVVALENERIEESASKEEIVERKKMIHLIKKIKESPRNHQLSESEVKWFTKHMNQRFAQIDDFRMQSLFSDPKGPVWARTKQDTKKATFQSTPVEAFDMMIGHTIKKRGADSSDVHQKNINFLDSGIHSSGSDFYIVPQKAAQDQLTRSLLDPKRRKQQEHYSTPGVTLIPH